MTSFFDLMPSFCGRSQSEAMKILEQWVKTEDFGRWSDCFQFFSRLRTKDFLWLISKFPEIFLKSVPIKSDGNSYQLFKNLKNLYKAKSQWLLYYFDPSPGDVFKLLEQPRYGLYLPYADKSEARKVLCSKIMIHPLGDIYRQTFATPSFLWFMCEVAECREIIGTHGLSTPIPSTEIAGKRQIDKESQEWMRYLSDSATQKLALKTSYGIRSFIENLHKIIELDIRKISNQDTDFQDGVLEPYLSVCRAANRKISRSKEYQSQFLCSNEKGTYLVTTGKSKKLSGAL
ncbi:hypothetical protein LC608_33745 [Nostoc sp. XA010]|uniref:hypothetical protein n=1 Tax=Nostoc sp. XA010 TaxID=2780407 RepID=UPI001E385D04|nr:hypothetical protein [Nostoc sp. XA010]MCC5661824.1 hypothetical protein [Nostoc sp. XA010]